MKKLTVTIGIPAYNEEKNIGRLLKSLSNQKGDDFTLNEIVVLSDGSTDMTNEIVHSQSKLNRKIKLLAGKRMGKSRKISWFAKKCSSDILVFLDADVSVKDSRVLEKIVSEFTNNKNVGLLGICDKPNPARGLIQHLINENVCMWNDIKEKINDGNSIHNIHGCGYALSKKIYKKLNIPSVVFNDDEFAFLLNKKLGFDFSHNCSINIYYQMPRTIGDFLAQSSRFSASRDRTLDFFDDKILSEFEVPSKLKYRILLKHMVVHNVIFLGSIAIQIAFKIHKRNYKEDFEKGYWDAISSTKADVALKLFI